MSDKSAFEFDVVTVDAQGQEQRRDRLSATHHVVDLGAGITLEMVAIPAGTFIMGAPRSELGAVPNQSPQHLVTLKPFFLGKYPITQSQWRVVAEFPKINRYLDPELALGKNVTRPAERISWHDAVEFCARLTQYTGWNYRLPSEAEWEYACRAGTTTPFHFGETCTTDLANYSGVDWDLQGKVCSHGSYGAGPLGEDRRETTPVGYFQVANAFGLYDMHGLIREWCADSWHDNYQDAPNDGSAWSDDNPKRVLRGGSWNVGPGCCRSAFRSRFDADGSLYDLGFRVACS